MSDSNPILFSSAQSIEAYQQAIEQSTQAVMHWLKQPEMYQGKTVAELRDRIKRGAPALPKPGCKPGGGSAD